MTTKIDISNLKFSSAAFPTDEDMQLWNSLTAEEQHAYLVHWEEQGAQSGRVPQEETAAFFNRVMQASRAV